MDWSDPSTAIMSHGTAAVLRVLAGADYPFSVRELARAAGISPTRARQVTERLTDHGLLRVDATAGSHLVRLNRHHLAAEPALALAMLRSRALDRFRQEFISWAIPAIHVSLYGSAARGDGDTGSDLDLLVVREDFVTGNAWDEQVAATGEWIRSWTGNWATWFELSAGELERMAASGEQIVSEWRQDAITLAGIPLQELIRGVK